jgi:hypothetical protein
MIDDDQVNLSLSEDLWNLLPRHISDESASVLCNFLAELTQLAERRYFCKIRRYREVVRPPVDPQFPWQSPPD